MTKRLSQITSGCNHINSPVSYSSATSPELKTTIPPSASLSPSPHQTRASSPNSGPESSSDDYMDYRCNTLLNEVPCTFPVATRSADELQTDRNEMKHPAVNIDSERASFSSTFSSFTPYSTKSRPQLQARTCTSSEQMLVRISTDNAIMQPHTALYFLSMSVYLTCNNFPPLFTAREHRISATDSKSEHGDLNETTTEVHTSTLQSVSQSTLKLKPSEVFPRSSINCANHISHHQTAGVLR